MRRRRGGGRGGGRREGGKGLSEGEEGGMKSGE